MLLGSLGVTGLVASVLAVGLYLSSPATTVVGPLPDSLRDAWTVEIASRSGATIKGWWIASNDPCAGAVVLMHGVRSNRSSMVRRATKLRSSGFSVLLIDLQSHGESTGERITYGWRESLDAAAAVAFVRSRQPCARVGAIGTSLGGAAAVLGAQPLAVDALVMESVYGTIDSALGNRLRAGLGPVLGEIFAPILVPTFKLLLPPILGVTPDQLRPIEHMNKVTAPLLVISGTLDDRTPIAEARSMFDRASGPKRFWAVEGASHVDLEGFASDDYWRTVLPFLNEYLKQTTAR